MPGDELTYRPGLVGEAAAPARRVVTIDSGPLSLLAALGTVDRVVAANDTDGGWSTLPATTRAQISLLPRRFPTLADILAHGPDLVVAGDNEAFGDGALGARAALARRGIRSFLLTEAALEDAPVITPATIHSTINDTIALGHALGVADRAETIAAGWRTRIDAVASRTRRNPPRRVFVLDMPRHDAVLTAGSAAVVTDLLRRVGGEPVTTDLPFTYGWMPWHQLATRPRPHVLLVSDYGPFDVADKLDRLRARPEITAWRVGELPTVVLPLRDTVEGANNIDALEYLATAFADLPIDAGLIGQDAGPASQGIEPTDQPERP
ncbi:ABC-type Fe3+-hydroxamate transport system substrate-binding protein [Micromonospora sp. Llam0]|uniref:ABC transporter substrate-binding protein n=1 Tax=Micromonospora sp. Llam0 TaxID=2485143 RepID=UPI000F49F4CF|nr:ABC transporter substrate-binding protein [Micromonospora sp. Llam0]ROO60494.1 ABC-type Fe3+-hydroxamate transport system substrate-binding protein [Micromonospora sp. Llam0]